MSFLYQLQLQEGKLLATGQLAFVTDMETGAHYQTIITEVKKNDLGEIIFINVVVDPTPDIQMN